ncbi:hypothetical protein ACU4GH_14925 [Bradyrhizobium betae]
MVFEVDVPDGAPDGTCIFEIACAREFCPRDAGISDDERILGVHVRSVEIAVRGSKPLSSYWIAGLSNRAGRILSRLMRS